MNFLSNFIKTSTRTSPLQGYNYNIFLASSQSNIHEKDEEINNMTPGELKVIIQQNDEQNHISILLKSSP